MAQKVSQQEGAKSDFIQRFAAKYAESVLIRNNKNKEPPGHEIYSYAREEEDAEPDRVETNSALPGHEIFGFKNDIKSLKYFLLNPKFYNDFRSLVVVGEYGVGKTALCKKIFNNGDVKSVYAPRIWVSTHSSESEEGLDGKIHVLKRILEGCGVDYTMLGSIRMEAKDECMFRQEAGESDGETAREKEFAALLYALHLNLRWKKYLIVFDDVREEEKWDEKLDEKLKGDEKWGKHLSDGFPKGSGGRVIYTTRDKTLAKKLVSQEHEIHRLWPLSDSLSVWKIYEEALKENEIEPPRNNKKCIEELMNKSRGLPLALRLIAHIDPMFVDDEHTEQNDST